MAKLTVDGVQGRNVSKGPLDAAEQVKHRKQLHQTSGFESGRATFAGIGKPDLSAVKAVYDKGADGPSDAAQILSHGFRAGRIDVKLMSEAEALELDGWLSRLPASQRDRLRLCAVDLGGAAFAQEENGGGPAAPAVTEAAARTCDAYLAAVSSAQTEAAADELIRVGLWGSEKQLRDFFAEAAERSELTAEARTCSRELEEMLADWPDDGSTELFSYREVTVGADGQTTIVEHKNVRLTKEEAEALLSKLQGMGETLGGVEQRDFMKLQVMVHQHQQVNESISNILKQQHELRKTMISNARA